MAPFYSSLCAELGRTVDAELLDKMEADNKDKLKELEEVIEDARKNFGETERRDALMAKAEYFCKIGDKVCVHVRESPSVVMRGHDSVVCIYIFNICQ